MQNAEIDKIITHVLLKRGTEHKIIDFSPYGYDERQYCSPGIDLHVGCLMRTPHDQFPEYHTSADNLSFVKPETLSESLKMYMEVIKMIEKNSKYINKNPKCEPQLGRRGVYKLIEKHENSKDLQLAIFWVLNYSDGKHTLLDISEKASLNFSLIKEAAEVLLKCDLLEE